MNGFDCVVFCGPVCVDRLHVRVGRSPADQSQGSSLCGKRRHSDASANSSSSSCSDSSATAVKRLRFEQNQSNNDGRCSFRVGGIGWDKLENG